MIATPTSAAAHDAIAQADAAELTRSRLEGVMPQLRDRLQEALVIEQRARWRANRERFQPRYDKAVAAYRRLPELMNEIVNIFVTAAAIDTKSLRSMSARPMASSCAPSSAKRVGLIDLIEIILR